MTTIDIEAGLADFFAQDHRDCDSRWAELEGLLDNGDTDAANQAWQEFDDGMRRHFAMEEDILFPAFDARSGMGGGGPTAMMRMEHQQMRGLLDQIGAAMSSGDTEEALDLGDTLLMVIQQHNVKEEGMLYPMAENMLAGDWAALAEQLEKY
ncbi:MAG: hemerythrin domain-containing protein [Xanthomonadales bacterium]